VRDPLVLAYTPWHEILDKTLSTINEYPAGLHCLARVNSKFSYISNKLFLYYQRYSPPKFSSCAEKMPIIRGKPDRK